MEPRDLNRMFDALAPTPEQEQAGLDRLLQTERKGKPMKKLKKLTVAAIAAALMVISCAAAVVTGIDQRLLDYFGAGPEQAELLAPGAVPVDIAVEDNGAALRVTQVLMDRYNIMIVADFTAPEGTVLDMDEENDGINRGFGGMEWSMPELLNEAEEAIDLNQSWSWNTEVLDDGDPLDNHLTLLMRMELSEGIQPDWNISGMSLHNNDLVRYDPQLCQYVTVYSGDWSCQFPVTWQDMGQIVRVNQVAGQMDGVDISVTGLYLSPMTLQVKLERAEPVPLRSDDAKPGTYSRWISALNVDRVTLTTKDGQAVPLIELGSTGSDQDLDIAFRMEEITSLEQFLGGTLTLRVGDGSVDIPLEGLSLMTVKEARMLP